MDREEIKGKGQKIRGDMKQTAGRMTGRRDLEAEGAGDKLAGEVRESVGRVRRAAGDALDDVNDAYRRE